MENPVRITTLFVVKNAKDVKINASKIKDVVDILLNEGLNSSLWDGDVYLQSENKREILDFLIILDSLNFCFWSKKERWQIERNGKKYDGYYALFNALDKFFKENPDKTSLDYFSGISFREFKSILQGGKNLLFLKKRWQLVVAVSKTIIKKYKNSKNFVASADRKFSVLVKKIYKLPGFNDIFSYNGKKIYLLKRAQILANDIWVAFKGKGLGYFKDVNYLTCFPDYKVPQILKHFGILEYSPKLDKKIRNKILIPMGSSQEVEIRSATVQAVEMLRVELLSRGIDAPALKIDWVLWKKSKADKISCNYHLTKTIFY